MLHSKLIFKSCLLELYGILSHILKVTHPLPSYFSLHVNVFENWYSLDAVLCSDPRYNFSIMSIPKSSRFLKVVFCFSCRKYMNEWESKHGRVMSAWTQTTVWTWQYCIQKRGFVISSLYHVNMNSPQKGQLWGKCSRS